MIGSSLERSTWLAVILFAGAATVLMLSATTSGAEAEQTLIGSPRDAQRWNFFLREDEINHFWMMLSARRYPSHFAIENVSLIAMKDDSVTRNMTVIVNEGLIITVGPSVDTPIPSGARRINGQGKYLLPGLTDMHVHNLVSNSQQLLNLANGVTSVRDMSGFNWMLSMRARINDGLLLGPTMYVTGHILNAQPMQYYATAVSTPEAARSVVRDQATSGYDFIKIHNVMETDVFVAIHEEATIHGLDVVGHVPHGLTVAEAVAAGLRTFEHFKGYILDSSLTMSDEDYVSATDGQLMWNTPTFHTYRAQLRGDDAREIVMESDEIQYVSPSDRLDWTRLAELPSDKLNELRANVFELSKDIFVELQTVDAQFLAGTDSGGGTPFMIPGFALHDELRVMQGNGLTPFQTVQTATTNAAAAMRRSDEFGTIEIGKRADLLLVSADPLDTVYNLNQIDSVAVRGVWLDRLALDQILDGIARIYRLDPDEDLEHLPTLAEIDELIDRMVTMRSEGFVFRNFDLGEISRLLRKSGLDNRAAIVRSLKAR